MSHVSHKQLLQGDDAAQVMRAHLASVEGGDAVLFVLRL
jgi:hypothetical protein